MMQELINDPQKMKEFIFAHKNSYFISLSKDELIKGWLVDLVGSTIQEKLYNFCYGLTAAPLCEVCGKEPVRLKDRSFFRGYQKYCGPQCSASSKARIESFVQTCKDRFGGGPRSTKQVQEQYSRTWSKNKDKNLQSIRQAKTTRAKTCVEKFGVDHVFKVPSVQEKAQKNASASMHSYRQYVSKLGNVYRVRGYEDRAIEVLEEQYEPHQFIADDFATPRLPYIADGKDRNYYPDIFIPAENKIIEVKSWYWLRKQPTKNLAILEEALRRGFKFEFWVFSGKHLTIINTPEILKGYLQ
jgi:hypothetical protein